MNKRAASYTILIVALVIIVALAVMLIIPHNRPYFIFSWNNKGNLIFGKPKVVNSPTTNNSYNSTNSTNIGNSTNSTNIGNFSNSTNSSSTNFTNSTINNSTNSSITNSSNFSKSCFDSDGGKVYSTAGVVSGYYNSKYYSYKDSCVTSFFGSNKKIVEYYCSSNNQLSITYDCSSISSKKKCITSSSGAYCG